MSVITERREQVLMITSLVISRLEGIVIWLQRQTAASLVACIAFALEMAPPLAGLPRSAQR